MSDLIKRTEGFDLVADGMTDEAAHALVAGIAASVAVTPTRGGQPILRLLRHGVWVYGQGDEPVQDGSEWAANPNSFKHGWIAWSSDNRLVGESAAPMTSPMPLKPDPIDGVVWKPLRAFDLKCFYGDDAGTEVIFKTAAGGGVDAVVKFVVNVLTPQINREVARTPVVKDRLVVPIIRLDAGSYPNKTYGGHTFFPVFTLVSWATMDGREPEAKTEAAPATVEPKPDAAKPAAAPRRPTVVETAAPRPSAAPRRQRPEGRSQ